MNGYQLPHTPRIRGDLLPERDLCNTNTTDFQVHASMFPECRLTFVPSLLDPHQDRSSALFVEPQNILPFAVVSIKCWKIGWQCQLTERIQSPGVECLPRFPPSMLPGTRRQRLHHRIRRVRTLPARCRTVPGFLR